MNFSSVFKSRTARITVAIIVIAGLTAGGYYIGLEEGRENPRTVIVRGVSNLNQGKEEAVDFSLFWEAWNLLKERKVDAEKTGNQDLVYGAIQGMFAAYDDPNTVFLPPADAKKFGEDISGKFSGIGAEIGIKNEGLVIIAPLKGSPAERAELKPNDKIFKIDDTATNGMTVEEAVKRIRGKEKTSVNLNIFRDGWDKPRDIKIEREIIQIPTIDFKILGIDGKENSAGPIAYIHLFNFYERAPLEFYKAALQAVRKNPKGVIFDLRNNPGGYLDAGIDIAGVFLKSGVPVVSEEFRGGEKDTFKARGNGVFKDMPVVVLINEGSASASEIVAGALRDSRGIKLVGEKSFGKGTVQEVDEIRDSLAKITIAHWLTPNGHLIDKNGLEPDYKVEISDDDVKNNRDPQLEKAVEVLKSQINP